MRLVRTQIPARASLMAALAGMLLAGLGCREGKEPVPEKLSPARNGEDATPRPRPGRARPDPSPARPGAGCETLCARHAGCLARFRALGAEPVLGPASNVAAAGCVPRCRAARGDDVLQGAVETVLRQCVGQRGCDAFYGCALRQRLAALKAHPWKGLVLRGRRALQALEKAETNGGKAPGEDGGGKGDGDVTIVTDRPARLARCAALAGLRRRLGALDHVAARRIRARLKQRCRHALAWRLTATQQVLDRAERTLELEAARRVCERLSAVTELAEISEPGGKAPPAFTAQGETLRTRCRRLSALRAKAAAARDAERDAAEVDRLLSSGGGLSPAYHKCAHKADTLRLLLGAEHSRARQAAERLRLACFERFPRSWLRRQQRRSEGDDLPGGCYRLRKVLALLVEHARPSVRARHSKLIRWARRRCPAGG